MTLLSPQHVQRIEELCHRLFQELARTRDPVPELCHYTSARGLKGILESGKIWATNIAYVNDAKEYQHSVDSFLDMLAAFHGAVTGTGVADSPTRAMTTRLFEQVRERVVAADIVQPVWVACFSPDPDDLGQWRSYGMGEGGYSICFDRSKLEDTVIANNDDVGLLPCVYDNDAITHGIRQLLGRIMTLYVQSCVQNLTVADTDEFRKELAETLILNLHHVAPIVKHYSFKSEHEWRIVKHTPLADVTQIEFLPKPTMMSAYVPVDLTVNTEGKKLLPLTRVMVGPSRYKDISAVAVRAMLTKLGYADVQVMESISPYRVS